VGSRSYNGLPTPVSDESVDYVTTRLIDACRRKPVDATPIWLMRQAGRYLPEYRAIKEKLSFIEMCKRPDVATEVTLQPLKRFELDAAIVFADILLPLEGMGIGFHFAADHGPVIERTVRSAADLEGVRVVDPHEDVPYLYETLRMVRAELDDDTALIGFAGAPFTLASYVVEGGHSRHYAEIKKLMYAEPETYARLMDLLADSVIVYLQEQVAAGAQVLQLFDSWVGCLSPYDYERLVLPWSRRVLASLSDLDVPVIHFANGASTMLPLVAQAGGDVVGVDWHIDLDEAWRQLDEAADSPGERFAVQGNLDPIALLGPPAELEARAADVLRRARGRAGHIFNLGHGLIPAVPPDNVRRLVDFVHSWHAE
jgi:uroporphyrinogen decarboxylase